MIIPGKIRSFVLSFLQKMPGNDRFDTEHPQNKSLIFKDERGRLKFSLGERLKEMNCIYSLLDISRKCTTINSFLEKLCDIIPPAFQFPEITECIVIFNDKEFKSSGFKTSNCGIWKLNLI